MSEEQGADPAPEEPNDKSASQAPDASEALEAPANPERRSAMKKLVVVGSAAYAGAVAVPAIAFLTGDDKPPTSSTFRRLIALAALEEGVATRVAVSGQQTDAFTRSEAQILGSVWLQRRGNEVLALAAECPHLGCAIGKTSKGFSCPCHTSAFDANGKSNAGPSPRDMDRLESRVQDGFVEVKFVRFKQGSKTQEVVS